MMIFHSQAGEWWTSYSVSFKLVYFFLHIFSQDKLVLGVNMIYLIKSWIILILTLN
jgi:hypothetical protein